MCLAHECRGLQTRDLVADRACVGQQPFQDRSADSLAAGLWAYVHPLDLSHGRIDGFERADPDYLGTRTRDKEAPAWTQQVRQFLREFPVVRRGGRVTVVEYHAVVSGEPFSDPQQILPQDFFGDGLCLCGWASKLFDICH